MGFVDNVAAQKGASIYGQPGASNDNDVMSLVNQLKDREMNDFKNKSVFAADLSLKQDKLRALFNPDRLGLRDNLQPGQPMGSQGMPGSGMNTVMAQDPNMLTGYQKGELGIRQQGLNLESQKLAQTNRLGQGALDIRQQQTDLNQEKSNQINATKQADMERKIKEADDKLELAKSALNSKDMNAEKALAAHKELAAAVEERHKLEIAQRDAQFNKLRDEHERTIKNLEEKTKQGARSKTTVEQGGEKRTTTVERGDASSTVTVTGKDGKTYTIPKDKLNDMDADGTPHWKQQDEEE